MPERSGVQSEDWLKGLVDSAKADGSKRASESAVELVSPELVEQLTHQSFEDSGVNRDVIAIGVAASPGAASGVICLSCSEVIEAVDRNQTAILVCVETSPADEPGMRLAQGIVTARGGMASHAAVVARGWGIPAVVGVASLRMELNRVRFDDREFQSGDGLSLNGSTGDVLAGYTEVSLVNALPELETLLSWADQIRAGRVQVMANADTHTDAQAAQKFGADGIGLCRTEHTLLGERLPLFHRFLEAQSKQTEEEALLELGEVQREDFESVLACMSPKAVTFRLLDAPLHEFGSTSWLSERAEHNPMLGTRGVRLAILREGLYRMQAKSLVGALANVRAAGIVARAELLVPLVSDAAELSLVRSWLDEELAESPESIRIGAMIETPRAALVASEMAAYADFFSFGTNDLTQFVFGFSRDDIESQIMARYLELGILDANPFEKLDPVAVAPLLASAIKGGRMTQLELPVGICGEHGGDPSSIRLLVTAGINYVSCSPFRIPVTRLAVAQALLEADESGRE